MKNNDESMRERTVYLTASQIGAVGSILLIAYAVLGDTLAGLLMLSVWATILAVAPRLYLRCKNGIASLGLSDIIYGPHQ